MTTHNLPPIGASAIAVFLLYAFALGLVLVWLYAAIRPRFGAGPRTAIIAGVAVWFLAYVTGAVNFGAIGLVPAGLLLNCPCVGTRRDYRRHARGRTAVLGGVRHALAFGILINSSL